MAWDDDAYYETELEIPSGRYGKLIAIPGGPGPSGPPGPQGPAGADSTVPGPQGEPGAGASTWDEVSDKPEGVPGGFPVLDGDGNVPAENLPDVYAATIVDSTEVGRAVVVAVDEKAARTAIGPGGVDFIGVPTFRQAGGTDSEGQFAGNSIVESGYVAAVGDIVLCDSPDADFTVRLPEAPADGSQVTVKRADTGPMRVVVVEALGADAFETAGGAKTFRLRLPSQTVKFQYDAGVWRALDLSVALYRLALLQSPADALISRMAVPPTDARKQVITGLVNDLQVCGVWDKLDALYVFAAHDHQAALLNWKGSVVEDAVAVNSPVFTVDRGFTGDGQAAFIDTVTPPGSWVKYRASDATMGVHTRTAVSLNRPDMAAVPGSGITAALDFTNSYFRLNSAATAFAAPHGGSRNGFFAVSRLTGADTGFAYRNGAFAGSGALAAGEMPKVQFDFLRAGLTSFSTREVSVGFWGAGLTAQEHADTNTAITIYMTAIGAAL